MLIKNGKILVENGKIEKRDILIENGKIVKIDDNIMATQDIIVDASEKLILPGVIDVHTHMRDPGLTHKEDFESGSKACVKGGVTTFLDMPNTIPNTTTEENLKLKRELALGRCYCNFGFHFGGSREDNSEEIKKVNKYVASTKIFLNMSTGNMLVEDERVLEKLVNSSKLISVHAEGDMIKKAINLSKKYDKPFYLCHISTLEELELIRKAKKERIKIYAEVTPHHLFFSEENRDNLLRMKPELKSKIDCEALWQGIEDGTIDTIGTDHAPHRLEEKQEKIVFGIPSIENSFEMMLKAVETGKLELKKLVELTSTNPAKIFKLKNKYGISLGADADLIIIDLNKKYKILRKDIITKSGWSPYEGMETGGTIETTIVRGNIVYNKGDFYKKMGEEVRYDD